METLAERLRSVREELGYNKAELKRRAGLGSASTITELENGTISQSPQIPKIAAALGVEAVWLQSGRGPKHRGKASPLEDIDAARIAELYLQLSPSRRAAAEQLLLGLVAVEQAEKSVAP